MDDVAHVLCASQGTKLSLLVAMELSSVVSVHLFPQVLEKQNKTHVSRVDHSKQCLQMCFTGVLDPHHV